MDLDRVVIIASACGRRQHIYEFEINQDEEKTNRAENRLLLPVVLCVSLGHALVLVTLLQATHSTDDVNYFLYDVNSFRFSYNWTEQKVRIWNSSSFSLCFWKSSDRTNRFSGYDECVSTKYLMPALLRLAKHPVILQLLFRQVCGASFYYYLLKLFCSFNKESVIMILRCQIKCFYGFALLVTASLSGCSLTDKHHGVVNKVPIRTLIKGWRRKAQEQSIRLSNRLQPYPENLLTPPQIIEKRGYPVEIHQVITDDGYILDIHRIPAKSSSGPKQVVFLQHGVAESSGTWLVNPASRSLPLLLADKSYDVWLGNVRGNRFSRRHVSLDPKKAEFWKFSWDEIGNYDLPAIINYILKETGQPKISYIGHSLGCATFFIAMLKHPELNDKIDIMVALAPVSSFAHFTSPIFRFLAPFGKPLEKFFRTIGTWGWLDGEGFGELFFRAVCGYTYKQAKFCGDLIIFVTGPNPENLDPAISLLAISNVFRGTSVPVIAQFSQNFLAGDVFQAYDYGKEGNLKRYGTKKPMNYELQQVTAPVYVFSAGNDRIVSPLDVDWLEKQLGNLKGSTRIPFYNHIDFIWGTDVKEKLYDQVMALLPSP